MNFLHSLIPILITFSYANVAGIRLAIFIPIVLFLIVLFQGHFFCRDRLFVFNQILIFSMMLSFSLITGFYDNFLAYLVFMILSITYSVSFISIERLDYLIKIYTYLGVFSAVGLFVQYVLYNFLGYSFGTIIFFNNRTAFSFLWLDFSFFSLYLASLVPLIFYVFKNIPIKILLSLFVLVASFMTTARTGIFSFIFFCIIFSFYKFFESLVRGEVKKEQIKFLVVGGGALFLSFLLLPYLSSLSDREITTSDSGRMQGYIDAWHYLGENFFFGAMFNSEYYFNNINVLPHNAFLYIFTMGGILFLLLFFVFIALVLFYSRNKFIVSSILISFIGVMFIPSFYSMYYLGWLISMAFAYYHVYLKINEREEYVS
ncbi:hypothetical protein [Acinetobacter indicus]|uniref:hypothetical protein n=1 Tax=Acinetobacter indicus TaxID=756892 RepID=UPI000CEC1289|nr:hypothetical protein [Acinetobacter indicus]